jgi:hypothetical protein
VSYKFIKPAFRGVSLSWSIVVLGEIGVLAQRDAAAISSFVVHPSEKSIMAKFILIFRLSEWILTVVGPFGKPDRMRWQGPVHRFDEAYFRVGF